MGPKLHLLVATSAAQLRIESAFLSPAREDSARLGYSSLTGAAGSPQRLEVLFICSVLRPSLISFIVLPCSWDRSRACTFPLSWLSGRTAAHGAGKYCESEHKDEGGEELEYKAMQRTQDVLSVNSKVGLEAHVYQL